MCQIIKIKETKNNKLVSFLLNNRYKLQNSLDLKGGEGYSFFLSGGDETWVDISTQDFNDGLNEILKHLIDKNWDCVKKTLVLFSRQKPEMEKSNVSLPPYFNEDKTEAVWMHGTIFNVEELEKKYNVKVNVDSEILLYAEEDEIEGNYSALIWHEYLNYFMEIDRGLGLYEFDYENEGIKLTTTDATWKQGYEHFHDGYLENNNLTVSYSGGMDISLSLIHHLFQRINYSMNYEKIHLIYFDYGARAKNEEIQSLYKMKDYLINMFNILNIKTEVEAKVLKVEGLIQDISKIYNKEIKLISEDAKADSKESESTLAYIPFRNTIFVELLATYAEGLNLDKVNFMVGLNLSEGMIFSDNSEIWLKHINALLPRAGKKYNSSWKIIAPYYNKTKTNMIKDFVERHGEEKLNEILDISFSCYYPKNNKPCGECGSCILRNKAIEIAKITGEKM